VPGRGRPERLSTAIFFALYVALLGIPDGALGVIWPTMRVSFGRPLSDLGVVALAGTALYIVGSALTGRAMTRLGAGNVALIAGLIGVAALAAWLAASAWWVLLAALAVFGLGRGVLDTGGNTHLSITGGVRHLGFLHASYGVGATLGPVLAGAALAAGIGWRGVVAAMLVPVVVIASASALLTHRGANRSPGPGSVHPGSVQQGSVQPAPPPGGGEGRSRARVSRRVVIGLMAMAFLTFTGAEAATGSWGYAYLTQVRHYPRGVAASALAGFWAAFTTGRFLVGAAGHRLDKVHLLSASCVMVVAGLGLLWLGPLPVSLLGVVLTGAGVAAFYPVLIALVPDRVGKQNAPRAIAVCVVAGAIGAPLVTALVGVVVANFGVRGIAPSLMAAGLALVLAHLALAGASPVVTRRS
jgi:fucose permease